MSKKAVLCILDGWGLAAEDQYNAIQNARTPVMDMLMQQYSWCTMKTDGETVGLPHGQVGTSETNHLVIGSGTVPRQMLLKIEDAVADGSFYENEELLRALQHATQHKSTLHLIGIVSDGGVHSHINHLFALLEAAARQSFVQPIVVHVFTDGRDTPPQSATTYLQALEQKIAEYPQLSVAIGSLQGRVYLDRDTDWSKTQKAVDLLLHGVGHTVDSWDSALQQSYSAMSGAELNDQYHEQYVLPQFTPISSNDACIVFNFRADRSLQLLQKLEEHTDSSVYATSFCKPSEKLHLTPLFTADEVKLPLSEILSSCGKTQLHISETEKHVHVTYYFDGKREREVSGEVWKIFESNRAIKPHYNKEPEMRAAAITEEVARHIADDAYDFYVINYPNTDMVGHTGDYAAAVKAAEYVDACLGKLYESIENKLDEYVLFVTADHGNSDIMWNYEINQPHTAHTHSLVPFVAVSSGLQLTTQQALLSDIAPTILTTMGIDIPHEMTGVSLIEM